MESKILDMESRVHMEPRARSNDMATEAFGRVIGESWQRRIKDDKQLNDLLQEHANNMRNILGSFDYEINTIHNTIANAKRMGRGEARSYIKNIEALAFGYKAKLGADVTSALLAGLTMKAKDLASIQKFSNLLIEEIEAKIRYNEARINSRGRGIERLMLAARYNEASILRFLRRKKINGIKRRVESETKKVRRLEEKKKGYEEFLARIMELRGAGEGKD